MPFAPPRACLSPRCGGTAQVRGRCRACASAAERRRGREEPWRALYQDPRWQTLRRRVLAAASHLCQCEDCARRVVPRPAGVVDHRVPHRGDQELFFDPANLRALAKVCHDRKTAGESNLRRRVDKGAS